MSPWLYAVLNHRHIWLTVCGPSKVLQGMVDIWMVVGPTYTHDGLFIECILIYCHLHVWLTVCKAIKILQGMVDVWVVVGPTHDGLFIECILIPYCHLHVWLTVCEASKILEGMVDVWVVAWPHKWWIAYWMHANTILSSTYMAHCVWGQWYCREKWEAGW